MYSDSKQDFTSEESEWYCSFPELSLTLTLNGQLVLSTPQGIFHPQVKNALASSLRRS